MGTVYIFQQPQMNLEKQNEFDYNKLSYGTRIHTNREEDNSCWKRR